MKKTFASIFVFFAAVVTAAAQSTCETRVDSHPDATTKQRVAYCLTPEEAAPQPAGPQVVFYSVTDNRPQPTEEEETQPKEPVYFDKDGVAVNQNFQDTKNFPAFENDRLSVQDRLAMEELGREEAAKATQCCQDKLEASAAVPSVAARPAAVASAQNTSAPQTPSAPISLGAPSVLTEENAGQETAQGVADRSKKPQRFMKESAPTPADYGVAADPAAAYDPAAVTTDQAAYQNPSAAYPYAAADSSAQQNPYAQPQTGTVAPQYEAAPVQNGLTN